MFTAQDILDIAIRLENNGEKIYLDARQHTADAELRALLAWIAAEERSHASWFEGLRDRLSRDEDYHVKAEMSRALVEDVVQGQAFSLQAVDFRTIDTPDKMIRTFIGFEEDTIAFYEILATLITDPSMSGQLGEIIDEEKTHIAKFRQLLTYN
jgi:rubrerythrin